MNEILRAAGLTGRVRMLDEAVTTARAAAEHLGCPVGAIANSLIFETFIAASVGMREQLTETAARAGMREQLPEIGAGAPLLIMTSGAHRVDMSRVGEQLGAQLRRASPAFVREHTGQPIGGVAPVGHPRPIRTVVDRSLAEFDELWAAGGIPHAVFPMTYDELIRLTSGVEADVS
ncbi:MAG TPA: YbaK/EbsC family protein [Propionibacteriaceae bacterium]|nr:YbaK/EbsC family protein [Propionibacteriaceae bacterium]